MTCKHISAMTSWEWSTLKPYLDSVEKKKIYLEIGSANGKSLNTISSIIDKRGILIGVDLFYKQDLKNVVQKLKSQNRNIHFIKGDSKLPKIKNEVVKILNGQKVDILFIDGDHTLWGVENDIQNYTPLVRQDGLIIFHDCGFPHGAHRGRGVRANVHPAFYMFVYDKPYVLIQEHAGIGIVWNRKAKWINSR